MGNLIPERVFTRTLPVRCRSPLRRKKRTADPLIWAHYMPVPDNRCNGGCKETAPICLTTPFPAEVFLVNPVCLAPPLAALLQNLTCDIIREAIFTGLFLMRQGMS